MLEENIGLISTLGFPIFICLWFMFRLEPIIKNNTKALTNFQVVQNECKSKYRK